MDTDGRQLTSHVRSNNQCSVDEYSVTDMLSNSDTDRLRKLDEANPNLDGNGDISPVGENRTISTIITGMTLHNLWRLLQSWVQSEVFNFADVTKQGLHLFFVGLRCNIRYLNYGRLHYISTVAIITGCASVHFSQNH